MYLLSWVAANTIPLLSGVIGIGLLIGVHEYGHFIMCKLFGIHTPSFSIGFGPTLVSKTIGETLFTLRAIPLGGYVEIAGLAEPGQGEQASASRDDEHSFTTKSYPQKLLVALGGIIFNLLFSIVVFSSILYIGAPKTMLLFPYNTTNTVAETKSTEDTNLPIQSGDVITSVDETAITSGKALLSYAAQSQKNNKEDITVTYMRNETEQTASITPSDLMSGRIQLELKQLQATSIWHAIQLSLTITRAIIYQVYNALYKLIVQQNGANMGGPLMIIAASMQGAQSGILTFFIFLSFLSINLAALNILPIPVLDGGHIVFLTIETIMGRSIPEHIRGYIDYTFAILLITFVIVASFFDIRTLFGQFINSFNA